MTNSDTYAAGGFFTGTEVISPLLAQRDWASTRLGPPSAWPHSLRTATAILLGSPTPMALLWGESGVLIYNDGYANLMGRLPPGALGSEIVDCGLEMAEVLGQALRAGLAGANQVFRNLEFTVERSGKPEQVWIDVDCSPVPDESGHGGALAICIDATGRVLAERKAAHDARSQAALEESHRRLNAAMAIARLGVFEIDHATDEAIFDARAREVYGFGPDEHLTTQDVINRIENLEALRDEAFTSETNLHLRRMREYRIHLPDGSVRDILSSTETILGADGQPMRTVGVFDDVTDRRRAEHRQQLLINELNHRVKNSLATVQAIAAQTLRSAPSLPSARELFEDRLMALAAAHDLLTAESWSGARLRDVVASALAPFETTQRPQVLRSGPPVWVAAYRALALSLALHELATNAAKYGALSVPEGRVTISWSVSGSELRLLWIEEGGPPVAGPARSGFGTRLLQRNLPRELQGDVALTFAAEGVRCEVRCNVEDAPSGAASQIEKMLAER